MKRSHACLHLRFKIHASHLVLSSRATRAFCYRNPDLTLCFLTMQLPQL